MIVIKSYASGLLLVISGDQEFFFFDASDQCEGFCVFSILLGSIKEWPDLGVGQQMGWISAIGWFGESSFLNYGIIGK